MISHNTYFRFSFLVVLSVLLLSSIQKAKADNETLVALSRKTDLKTAQTPTDSIKILLDIYNLSDKINRDKVRMQIIDLTQRSDSEEVIASVLRELSTSTDVADDLAKLLEISESIPDSNKKESIQTVIHMEHAASEASNVADSDVEHQIAEFARQGFDLNGNPYKEIQNIYRAMTYLGTSSQGPLYFEYMKRLEELVNELPENEYTIRNLFYTTAAIFYTRKRDFPKAIEFDRLLLKQLDDMDAYYQKIGDQTHDLDYFYFLSYRRLLRNFKGLTPEEVEDIYQKCLQLAREDEKVAASMGHMGLTSAYYYLATNQYKKAIPELKKALASDNISKYRRRELLGSLASAYRETGDSKGELETLRPYVSLLLEDREERLQDMYKEIELRNSVSKIINEEYRAQEQQRHENSIMRKTSLTLVYVLGIILIFLCGAYFKLRNKVKELQTKNSKLRRNIEYIFDDGVPKGSTDPRRQKNRLKG